MPPRVFQYGLLSPFDLPAVRDQMTLAHRYRNKLTEIERERRMRVRDVLGSHPAIEPIRLELEAAMAAKESARQQIATVRSERHGIKESKAQRQALKDAGQRVRELAVRLKETRKVAYEDPELQAMFKGIDLDAKNRIKLERSRCGVYWGTYLLVEAAADQSARSKELPRFSRAGRGGKIGVQIQGGMPASKLFEDNRLVRIRPVDPRAWDPATRRGDRRRACRTRLHVRIGSNGKEPIWACFPMIMHRPLPPGSTVKAVSIRAVPRDVSHVSWFVDILVDVPEAHSSRARASSGTVAINLGYCKRPDGSLRAGYLVGDDGYEREILVPFGRESGTGDDSDRKNTAGVIDRLNKASSIQGIRQRLQDQMKADLMTWYREGRESHRKMLAGAHLGLVDRVCGELPPVGGGLGEAFLRLGTYIRLASESGIGFPLWFMSRTRTIHAWKSSSAFVALAQHWRCSRFDGDSAGYAIIEAWRYRNEHLDRYERGLARQAILHRREIFRTIAAKMAARYHTLVVDDTNLTELVKSPVIAVGSNHGGDRASNLQKSAACPSQLRTAFTNAFGPTSTVTVSSVDVTACCHRCSVRNEVEVDKSSPDDRGYECAGCAERWDIDANACRNLLARERQRSTEDREAARGPKSSTSRRFRAGRLSEARAKLAS